MGNKLKTVDAETLLSTPMSKTMFIVDGLISQGVNVISGASKIGKSWLMLWLGLQVAQGNSVWGLPTLQCDVLYLSLEDTQRRIKDRLYNLTDSAPDNLYFAVTSGLIGGGLEEQITDFLTEHPATKMVIIDTLQKVRDSKGSTGKAGMYGNDYDDISSIKRIADGFNIAILLVHHLRKLQDSDDPFNDVSGSTGIIGAADTNFILRRKRSGSPTVVAAAITSRKAKNSLPTHILLENVPGLAPTSLLLLEQLRTIDRKRLRGYIGRISKEKMLEVDAALAISIGIGYPNERRTHNV